MTGDGVLIAIALILAALLVVGLVQAFRIPKRSSRRIRRRGARRAGHGSPRGAPETYGRSVPPRLHGVSPAELPPASPSVSGEAPSAPGEAVVSAAPITVSSGANEPLPAALTSLAPFAPSEESPSPSESAAIPLEECRRLDDAKRHAELLLLADPHLQRAPVGPDPALAELWSLVGRSRLALSDLEGAAAAFEAAIHSAPESDRAVHEHHLAALALREGRRLLSRAERATKIATGEERIKTLRQAVRWFKRGALTVPENEEFAAAEARAKKALWAAYGRTATALLQRREFQGTRRLLQEALSQSELPRDRQDEFKELLAAAFVGEIGEIVAQAIRSVDQELKREALTLLRRAEGMLSSIPTEAMVKERLQDVNRRLWSGYTKLGLRRVEAGEFAEALEPLFHALRIDGVDPERQDETRAALVQALNHLIRERASRIDQLMAGGELETAVSEGAWLRGVVEEGRELGVREDELAAALALARPIMAQLDRARSEAPP